MSNIEAWNEIYDDLKCAEYWRSISSNNWVLIDYYIELIKKDPNVTKRTAALNVERDLKIIQQAFPEDSDMIKTIKSLNKAAQQTDCQAVNDFWKDEAPNLSSLAIRRKVNRQVAETSLETQAASSLSKALKRTPSTNQSSAKNPKKAKVVKCEDIYEFDGIAIPGSEFSLGTIIKRAAYDIFYKNQKKLNKLAQRKRKIMCAGLSSVLDISDLSFDSQRALFTKDQWTYINDYFNRTLSMELVKLEEDTTDTIIVTENVLKLSGDYKATRLYVAAQEDKFDFNTNGSITHQLMKCTLNLMQRYQHLFKMPPQENIRENDYLRLVWSPIFEILFPPEGIIRVVAGESINPVSTQEKSEQYPDNTHIHGFKVDFRFVVDVGKKEMDLGVGECAKSSADKKTIDDSSKLLRESKEAIDGLVPLVYTHDHSFKIFSAQCTGTHCDLNTTHLVANGLYVTKFQYSFDIPSDASSWGTLKEILPQLLTMKRELTHTARDIMSGIRDQSPSPATSFNRSSIPPVNEKTSWLRETWHSPPTRTEPRLPSFFMQKPVQPPPAPVFVDVPVCVNDPSTSNVPDIYGYVKVNENEYYNIYTKKTVDKPPIHQS